MKKTSLSFLYSTILLIFGCTDFKGASDPYIYTPAQHYDDWIPKKPNKRLTKELRAEAFACIENKEPLSLAEVIDISLLNNPDTQVTWANSRLLAAVYGRTLSDDFVLAEGNGSATRFRAPIFTGPTRSIVYNTLISGDLNLSYLVFDFGRTRNTSRAALEALYNADWTHNREIQTVMQTVMGDYYNYLYQQELLSARDADVMDAQVTLNSVLEKLRQGTSDVGEKVQATTQLLQAKLNVVGQKQQLHTNYTKIIADMGIPADLDLTFDAYPEKINPFEPEELNQLIETAIKHRPDLIAAESSVKASQFGVKAAKALYLPEINATFDIGRTYYSSRGVTDDYHYQAQAELAFPIFLGFEIKNTVRHATAQLEKAQAMLKQVQLGLMQDVSNQREDVVLAQEALEYAKSFLDSAKEDYRVNLAKYQAGTGTITELINAQTSVSDARAKYAQSKRDWFVSIANLAYALGTLSPPNLEADCHSVCPKTVNNRGKSEKVCRLPYRS